jgi:hypothetical protein
MLKCTSFAHFGVVPVRLDIKIALLRCLKRASDAGAAVPRIFKPAS